MFFPLDNLPNTAISFGQSNKQGSTLILQVSNPSTFNTGMGMKYTVKQSQSQSAVVFLQESGVSNIVLYDCAYYVGAQ